MYNGLLYGANFAVQVSRYIHAGRDPQKSYTLKYVQSLTALEYMKKIFWGREPNVVVAGVEVETDLLYRVANHLRAPLQVLASLTVVLLANLDGKEVSNFIVSPMAVQKRFPPEAEHIWRANRAVSSL